jgi:hypothetical protein
MGNNAVKEEDGDMLIDKDPLRSSINRPDVIDGILCDDGNLLEVPTVEGIKDSEDLVHYRARGPTYNFRGKVGWCIPVALCTSLVFNILGLT